jgi:hypothetical protein
MSNKIKLNLEELKVESFITSLKDEEKDKIKGGSFGWSIGPETQCSANRLHCLANSESTC